jgi:hypothetical protein
MCGKHRKRPAAEEADDDEPAAAANGANQAESPVGFVLSALPPVNGKPSMLLGAPVAYHPIVVHAGPAKTSAETQFAAAREQLARSGKLARNPKGTNTLVATAPDAARDAHTAPVALPNVQRAAASQPGAHPPASGPARITPPAAPPPGAFAPPPNQFTPSARMPSNGDTPSWMSFAPIARVEPAPLTAVPGASQAAQFVNVPLPRPRPKLAVANKPPAQPKKRSP